MKVTIDLDDKIAEILENKINEKLPDIVEQVLQENIDTILKDVVVKQFRGCALMYIQSPEFRQKMLDKVKPVINNIVENSND